MTSPLQVAQAIQSAAPAPTDNAVFWGVIDSIVSIAPPVVNVRINGATVATPNVACDSAFFPMVGDTVYGRMTMNARGPDYLIEGTTSANPWQPFTPTWISQGPVQSGYTVTNPVLGSGGSIGGRYTRIGKTVILNINIQFGSSGFNGGYQNNYLITLPFPTEGETNIPCKLYLGTAGLNVWGFASCAPGGAYCIPYMPAPAASAALSAMHEIARNDNGGGQSTANPQIFGGVYPFVNNGNLIINGIYETTA